MTTAPNNVDLAPGVYTLPGSSYLLVVDSLGAHLRLPASGPPSLLDLVTPPPTPTSANAAPAPTAPATSATGTPSWLVVLVALLVGAVGYMLYERRESPPSPSPVPVPTPAPSPTPAPPTPTPAPKKPDWLGDLEGKLDTLAAAMQRPSAPATPPDFTPLLAKLDELGRKLETPREAATSTTPGQVTPAPAVTYAQPQQQLVWYRGQWCTTGQCR